MTNQQAPEIYTLHTVPNKGERPWSGIYTVRADAEHDAKVMRDVTGRHWSVVRLVVADTNDRVPEAWTNLLAYVLQDELHNRLTPRVIDIAYTAFMQAKRISDEDGSAFDWFNDTRPVVRELIAKLRKDLIKELPGAPQPTPTAQADSQPALPEITAGDRLFLHYNPNTDDIVDWIQRYANTAITADRASRVQADSVRAASGANWQDISTAPKDGTQFVAVGNNYGLDSEAQHTCIAQWFRGCWMEVSDWNEASELKYLTHWMPLPPLPGSAASATADSVLEDADPLQGAANWLVKAHSGLGTRMLARKLSIGYNRAKRLHDAAIAAASKEVRDAG